MKTPVPARRNAAAPESGRAATVPTKSPEIRQILHGPALQAKLRIGDASSPHEQEAERVAEQVMRMPATSGSVQRAAAPPITSRSADSASGSANAISALRGGGTPMSPAESAFFEPRFGVSFADVRVHDGPAADRAARSVGAHAFALGSDIVFAAGERRSDAGGRRLMAHELTHTVQQTRNPNTVQRSEITDSRIMNRNLNPNDWYLADRRQWQDASMRRRISSLPQGNTFITAAFHNTQNRGHGEYSTVRQRHDYYDVISYVLEHDRNTPSALRNIRFFHATTFVTGSPGIGTVDSPAGAGLLRQDTRAILREVNAELFALNMGVIKQLIFDWREPRSPRNPQGRISAFEFDLQMVDHEQLRVEDYIRRNRSRFTLAVNTDINDTMDPNGFGQSFNPTIIPIEWALQALGNPPPDFTNIDHRKAIGYASVHIFHRKTIQEYRTFMTQRRLATQRRTP